MADTESSPPSPFVRAGRRALLLALAALTGVSLLGPMGAWWWGLDLLSHFELHYLGAALVGLSVALGLRWWRGAALSAVLVGLHLHRVAPLFVGPAEPPPAGDRLRLVSYNMHTDNPRVDEAARHVATLKPDVVALFEVSADQLAAFTRALPDHEALARPRNDAFGIAVLAREGIDTGRLVAFGPPWVPTIELEVPVGESRVWIAAVHPPPPTSALHSEIRDEVLRGAASWAETRPGPAVIVGDFNATPWSAIMRELLASGRLRSTQRFGVQPTWPTKLGSLGLPIDHAIHTPPLAVLDRRIEPAFGSDHRMLVIDLGLP